MYKVCLIALLFALPVAAQEPAAECDLDNVVSMIAVMQEALDAGDSAVILETLADLEQVVSQTYDACTSIVLQGEAKSYFMDVQIPAGYYTITRTGGGNLFALYFKALEGECTPSSEKMTFIGDDTNGILSKGCTARMTYLAFEDWTVTLRRQHD